SSISLLTILRSGPKLRKKSGRKSSNGSNKMLSPSATNSSAHQQLKHLVTHEATKQPSMGKTQNKSYCSRLRSESNLDRWNKNLEKHHCVHRRFQVIQANMVKDPIKTNPPVAGSGTGTTTKARGSLNPVTREALITCPVVVYSPMVPLLSLDTNISPFPSNAIP